MLCGLSACVSPSYTTPRCLCLPLPRGKEEQNGHGENGEENPFSRLQFSAACHRTCCLAETCLMVHLPLRISTRLPYAARFGKGVRREHLCRERHDATLRKNDHNTAACDSSTALPATCRLCHYRNSYSPLQITLWHHTAHIDVLYLPNLYYCRLLCGGWLNRHCSARMFTCCLYLHMPTTCLPYHMPFLLSSTLPDMDIALRRKEEKDAYRAYTPLAAGVYEETLSNRC